MTPAIRKPPRTGDGVVQRQSFARRGLLAGLTALTSMALILGPAALAGTPRAWAAYATSGGGVKEGASGLSGLAGLGPALGAANHVETGGTPESSGETRAAPAEGAGASARAPGSSLATGPAPLRNPPAPQRPAGVIGRVVAGVLLGGVVLLWITLVAVVVRLNLGLRRGQPRGIAGGARDPL